MTTLMLDELSLEQRWALNEQRTDNKSAENHPDRWAPERKPSQPAIRPWWQRHDRKDDAPGKQGDPLWGRGSGGS